jgi:single stranded DNA-binding protein
MRGLAKSTLTGNLTGDPEIREVSAKGETIKKAEFSIAVNTKKEGDAFFFRCEAWRGLADVACMAKKGEAVLVTCDIIQNTWQDKEGKNRRDDRHRVDEFRFLGTKGAGNAESEDADPPF